MLTYLSHALIATSASLLVAPGGGAGGALSTPLRLLAALARAAAQALGGWLVGRLAARAWLDGGHSRGRLALALLLALALAPTGALALVPLLARTGSVGAILGALVTCLPARGEHREGVAAAAPAAGLRLRDCGRRALGRALARILAIGEATLGSAGSALAPAQIARGRRAPRGGLLGSGAHELELGRELRSGRRLRIPIAHTVVIGATGAGKTVTLRTLLSAGALSHGVIAVDGKGDPALADALARAALREGRTLRQWSPWQQTTYNPLARGSETEIVDKALAAESFGDTYYLRIGQRFLGFAVRALQAAGREVTLADLARFADPAMLEALAPEMEARAPGSWAALAGTLPRLQGREREALAGTQHRLATLAESDVGALLAPGEGRPSIDLLTAAERGEVVYFNLNADARPELARMLGAAIIVDLLSVAAHLQRAHACSPTMLLFDDVQAFASDAAMGALASLFARGRSAGLSVFLGTQSLADLELGSARRVAGQILDNRANLIVHRLPGFDSAARAARELGDHRQPVFHEQLEGSLSGWRPSGRATRSEGVVENVAARELMALQTGIAYVQARGCKPKPVAIRPR
ncbi:MAG TPA: type IV secretion system DNA-binding domain-containing protein [Solirubrobacteraceae bacterium]|nr:type IV secretion system DNA-binding domain-containing protein [Solirubrobacteraceae bacterium]